MYKEIIDDDFSISYPQQVEEFVLKAYNHAKQKKQDQSNTFETSVIIKRIRKQSSSLFYWLLYAVKGT